MQLSFQKVIATLISVIHMIMALFGLMPLPKSNLNANTVNVFVHGLGGWGDYDALNQVMPYWGMQGGNLLTLLEKEGYECYAASVGPVSSAWDRACELYAQLTGGVVDYGAAHSAEHNHARYGRTYEALFDGWSSERQINLLGHSFGGPTVRLFAQLCDEGDTAEQAATPADEISPLFLGGMCERIHSVTTLAGVNNGSTAAGEPGDESALMSMFMTIAKLMGNLPVINGIYDLKLEQFGITGIPGDWKLNIATNDKIKNMTSGKDHAGYDLTLIGAQDLNSHTELNPDIYYFAYALNATEFDGDGNLVFSPTVNQSSPAVTIGSSMGMVNKDLPYTVGGITVDESWLPHDGMVNVISALHPFGQAYTEFDSQSSIQAGIWNEMPIIHGMEHMYFMMGDGSGDITLLFNFFMQHLAYLDTTY